MRNKNTLESFIVPWGIWLILSLFFSYQLIERILPNIIIGYLMNRYKIDAEQIGSFTGIYYIGYVVAHIPLGIILEYFNARKVVPISIFLCVMGLIPLVYSDNYTLILFGRLLIGLSSGCSMVASFKLLRLSFGEKKFPKMLGLVITFGLLVVMFGISPLTKLIDNIGTINTLKYVLIFGIALTIISYFILPDTSVKKRFSSFSIIKDFQYLLSQKLVIIIGVLGGLMIGILEGFADVWSNQFIKVTYNYNSELASNLTQLIYFGLCTGLIIVGKVSEKTKSYYGIIIICGIIMFCSFIAMLNGVGVNICTHINIPLFDKNLTICVIEVLFFLAGFFSSYFIIVIAKTTEFVSIEHKTFISSICNMAIMSVAYIYHIIIGKTIKVFWDGGYNIEKIPI